MEEQSQSVAVPQPLPQAVEQALVQGNLQSLTTEQRVVLYRQTCESLGLNPLTTPFSYLTLNGKLVLYATRNCTDQLRHLYHVSLEITSREMMDDLYIVTTKATLPDGRHDEKMGVIPIANLKGEAKANALMKCETKSGRRVTLSICGLSLLDEMEVESIPSARVFQESDATEPKALEEHSQDPADSQPTKDQVDSLFELARQTDKELRDFGHYVRGLMGLTDDFRLSKKFLLAQMSMKDYDLAWTHFANALKESVEGEESDVPYFDSVAAPQRDATPPEPVPYSGDATREASATGESQVFATKEQITDLWNMAYQSTPKELEKVKDLMKLFPDGIPLKVYEDFYQEIAAKVKEG